MQTQTTVGSELQTQPVEQEDSHSNDRNRREESEFTSCCCLTSDQIFSQEDCRGQADSFRAATTAGPIPKHDSRGPDAQHDRWRRLHDIHQREPGKTEER